MERTRTPFEREKERRILAAFDKAGLKLKTNTKTGLAKFLSMYAGIHRKCFTNQSAVKGWTASGQFNPDTGQCDVMWSPRLPAMQKAQMPTTLHACTPWLQGWPTWRG